MLWEKFRRNAASPRTCCTMCCHLPERFKQSNFSTFDRSNLKMHWFIDYYEASSLTLHQAEFCLYCWMLGCSLKHPELTFHKATSTFEATKIYKVKKEQKTQNIQRLIEWILHSQIAKLIFGWCPHDWTLKVFAICPLPKIQKIFHFGKYLTKMTGPFLFLWR